MGKTEGEVGAFHRRLLPFCQPDALYTDIIFFLILPLFNFFEYSNSSSSASSPPRPMPSFFMATVGHDASTRERIWQIEMQKSAGGQ